MLAWPAAAFALLLGLAATAHLARTDGEITLGAGWSAGMAAGVLLVSPLFFLPLGLGVLVLAWKRPGPAPKASDPDSPPPSVWLAVSEGIEEALSSHAPLEPAIEREAQALLWRAHHTNPFRPEGPSGSIPHLTPSRPTEPPHALPR